jgi:hypothetical protein
LDTEASHSGLAAVRRVAHAVTPARKKKHGFALAFLMKEKKEQILKVISYSHSTSGHFLRYASEYHMPFCYSMVTKTGWVKEN